MTRKPTTTALYKEERTWFFGACALLLMMCTLYAYFVFTSVVHVAMRKELSQDVVELGSYVSQLEAQYIEAQHEVSEELASFDGYIAVEEKIFIDKTPTTLVLSLQNES